MSSETRGRLMTRDTTSSTSEANIIDNIEYFPRLDHATLFKTLKGLLDDGIKLDMEV